MEWLAHVRRHSKLSRDGGYIELPLVTFHGVAKGAIFAVHTHRTITAGEKELGVLEADHVDALWCTLRGNSFDIPEGARALVLSGKRMLLSAFRRHSNSG